MSAAPVVLPLIWATVEAMQSNPSERKGPHRLQLVEPNASVEATNILPRRQGAATTQHGNYAFYRKYTEGMLRRSMKMALETARVPSFLGRQIFRGQVTNHMVHGFDDAVIFVADIEKCVAQLAQGQQYLIKRIGMQEFTQEETAAMLGISLRTIIRRYNDALDDLTRILLAHKVMQPLMACEEEN